MKRLLPNLSCAAAIVLLMAASTASAAASYRSGDQFKIKRSDLRQDGGDYVESIDMLFKVGDPRGALVLGTTNGTVNVRTWSENMVRLVVDKRTRAQDANDARRILDMFRVQAMQGESDLQFTARARTQECARSVGVTFTVWVPRSYNVDIKTRSGNIEIPEMGGRFSAHTSDGKISVDCDTENLDIEVEDHTASRSDAPSPPAPADEQTEGPARPADPAPAKRQPAPETAR